MRGYSRKIYLYRPQAEKLEQGPREFQMPQVANLPTHLAPLLADLDMVENSESCRYYTEQR